jgi:transposase-like protein
MAQVPAKLKREWARKLKESGFEDIEQDEYNLKQWSNKFARPNDNITNQYREVNVKPKKIRNKKDEFQGKQDYFYYAVHFLNEHEFESNLQKVIWEYHTERISLRNIAKLLQKVNIEISHESVGKIIRPLVKLMKEKYFISSGKNK